MTHQLISFLKSGVRIIGYIALGFDVRVAIIVLVISELIGVIEEL